MAKRNRNKSSRNKKTSTKSRNSHSKNRWMRFSHRRSGTNTYTTHNNHIRYGPPKSQKILDHNLTFYKNKVFVNTYPDYQEKSSFEMCFSPDALENLLKTVGTNVPETGAKGFSPILSNDPEDPYRIGFDVTEYDELGSQKASFSMYSPDEEWGTERVNHYLDADDMRLWVGDIHSHPGASGYPSPESGDGLGDLGYVRKVFKSFPYLNFFLLPIITLENKRIVIHPWIIDRNRPEIPLIAKVKVCSPSNFPTIEPDYSSLENLEDVSADFDDADLPSEEVIPVKSVPMLNHNSFCQFNGNCISTKLENRKYCFEHDKEYKSYISRLEGVISPSFSKKRILVIGTGAGSIMCVNLARQMPEKLTLVDFDEVELHNLSRTAFGYRDLGKKKVNALKERILDANPFISVECIDYDVTSLDDKKMDSLFDVDMIIAGTDSAKAQRFINEKSLHYKIPAIFIGIHTRGRGGKITFVEPGQACYRCIRPDRYDSSLEQEFDINGETGSLSSCQLIDTLAMDILISYLERNEASEFGDKWDLTYNNSNDFEIQLSHQSELSFSWDVIHNSDQHIETNHRLELDELFSGPRFYTYQVPKKDGCPCCTAGKNEKEVLEIKRESD